MISAKATLKELWARQGIDSLDVDYSIWESKREQLRRVSEENGSCLFTVDVYKSRYDFASENFSGILDFNPLWIKNIKEHDAFLEERIHPDDRDGMMDIQICHSRFSYSLPPEERNDYRNIYQFRLLGKKKKYINVVSRQQVIQKDCNGKAWIIMGVLDISPDQTPLEKVKYLSHNINTGEVVTSSILTPSIFLTVREKEILRMIGRGMLSKEIAFQLGLSIHTVHNHRKNILAKLGVDNAIEAINLAHRVNLLD